MFLKISSDSLAQWYCSSYSFNFELVIIALLENIIDDSLLTILVEIIEFLKAIFNFLFFKNYLFMIKDVNVI